MNTLLREAILLSSGTLATLTNKRRYDELDKIQWRFIRFCQEHCTQFEHWQSAWNAFWVNTEIH